MVEPVILFLYDNEGRAMAGLAYQREAARVGFRVICADWKQIQLAPSGVVVLDGRDVSAAGELRPVSAAHVHPDVVVHRKLIWGQSEALVSALRGDGALCSYHPLWKRFGDKWSFETCFLDAERRGVTVPRPRTYLVDKRDIAQRLAAAGGVRPLIFKPSAASLCDGIALSSPASFDAVAREVMGSRWQRYVVQDLVETSLRCRGRRFDLRIYALVTCLAPLRFTVLRDGVVRLAARTPDPSSPDDPLAVLTGSTYRRRRGAPIENLGTAELLTALSQDGIDVTGFWDDVERVLGAVFTAFAGLAAAAGPANDSLAGCFYLAGTDLLMTSAPGGYALLFLETNYVPDLAGWGEAVDAELRTAHGRWLSELAALQRRRRPGPRAPGHDEAWRSWSRRGGQRLRRHTPLRHGGRRGLARRT